MPICSRRSCALAVRTQMPDGRRADARQRLGEDDEPVRRRGAEQPVVEPDRVHAGYSFGSSAFRDSFMRPRSSTSSSLTWTMSPFLTTSSVFSVRPCCSSLMWSSPSTPGQDLDEGAERRGALDRTLVDPAHLGLGGDRRDHLAGLLARLAADGGDGDEPAVLDADLGAGGVLDAADRLALRTDHVADLVRLDLHA